MSIPELLQPTVQQLLSLALLEDLTPTESFPAPLTDGDVTVTATIPISLSLIGTIFVKEHGILAGIPIAEEVFRMVDPSVRFETLVTDGSRVVPGQPVARVYGSGRAILVAERPALNFLGRLSGIATLTDRFVQELVGTSARLLDTRKTAPGFRWLDKYAVRMGGGSNHRLALYDMAMIKDNHIAAVGGIAPAVARIRARYGVGFPIIVEVTTLAQLREALPLHVTRILLDNMPREMMREAVAQRDLFAREHEDPRVPLEASGGVSLKTVRGIAETGVDYISSGALTHSATVLDVSLDVPMDPEFALSAM